MNVRLFVLLIAVLAFQVGCGNQERPPARELEAKYEFDLLPVKLNGKWGYVDRSGGLKLQPRFDEASKFCNGQALVAVNGKKGFIDHSGRYTIQPQFDGADECATEGLAAVCLGKCGYGSKDARWGFVNLEGKWIIEPRYLSESPFLQERAAVCVQDCGSFESKAQQRWGFIDKAGKTIVEPKFDSVGLFFDGIAEVTEGSGDDARRGWIDRTGKLIYSPSK